MADYHLITEGDSITFGYGYTYAAWPIQLLAKLNDLTADTWTLDNVAVSNRTISHTGTDADANGPGDEYFTQHITDNLSATASNVVMLWLGTNDMFWRAGWLETAKTAVSSWVTKAQAADIDRIIILPIIQRGYCHHTQTLAGLETWRSEADEYNAHLRTIEGVEYYDVRKLYEAFRWEDDPWITAPTPTGGTSGPTPPYFDHAHLNVAGLTRVANAIYSDLFSSNDIRDITGNQAGIIKTIDGQDGGIIKTFNGSIWQ